MFMIDTSFCFGNDQNLSFLMNKRHIIYYDFNVYYSPYLFMLNQILQYLNGEHFVDIDYMLT